jgi:hypothetical protein
MRAPTDAYVSLAPRTTTSSELGSATSPRFAREVRAAYAEPAGQKGVSPRWLSRYVDAVYARANLCRLEQAASALADVRVIGESRPNDLKLDIEIASIVWRHR